jgi:hypothetical protein
MSWRSNDSKKKTGIKRFSDFVCKTRDDEKYFLFSFPPPPPSSSSSSSFILLFSS